MNSLEGIRKEIAQLSRNFYQRGWSLATSSNYSMRISNDQILITASGIDKESLTADDTLLVTIAGDCSPEQPGRPSAETLLHCALYHALPAVKAVLHTHSIYSTILSQQFESEVVLEGYEMLKALRGVKSHEHREILPVFPNTQEMSTLAGRVESYLHGRSDIHGFLIAAHGLYTWGNDLAEAKRHTEALEFLLECEYRKLTFPHRI